MTSLFWLVLVHCLVNDSIAQHHSSCHS